MIFFELFAHNPTIVRVPEGIPSSAKAKRVELMYVLTTGTADVMVNNRVVEHLQHRALLARWV